MNVRELIELLQASSCRNGLTRKRPVVIGEGMRLDQWLLVTGVVGRRIAADAKNPDVVQPGVEAGVEIV
ncbi:MAG: hypothetical protein DI543_03980 [Bradyrhizobium icense]|jgi:hypothetical protein|nr:MAG: hypothetical protein DI543_03980 [Bradyrhizobium icense]